MDAEEGTAGVDSGVGERAPCRQWQWLSAGLRVREKKKESGGSLAPSSERNEVEDEGTAGMGCQAAHPTATRCPRSLLRARFFALPCRVARLLLRAGARPFHWSLWLGWAHGRTSAAAALMHARGVDRPMRRPQQCKVAADRAGAALEDSPPLSRRRDAAGGLGGLGLGPPVTRPPGWSRRRDSGRPTLTRRPPSRVTAYDADRSISLGAERPPRIHLC